MEKVHIFIGRTVVGMAGAFVSRFDPNKIWRLTRLWLDHWLHPIQRAWNPPTAKHLQSHAKTDLLRSG